jgi:hypothetical protein
MGNLGEALDLDGAGRHGLVSVLSGLLEVLVTASDIVFDEYVGVCLRGLQLLFTTYCDIEDALRSDVMYVV